MNRILAKITPILCITLLSAVAAGDLRTVSAAEILTGHWEAQVTGDGRSASFLFDLKATSASAFTGTIGISDQDSVFPIKDGKINGNNISFTGLGTWTGTLRGNSLTLTRKLDYRKTQYITAHRADGQ